MKRYSKTRNILNGVGFFALITSLFGGFVTLLVLSPVITFLFAYIGGMILDLFVGNILIRGLNLIFNTTRFTRDLIPIACATLATIGKYFKSVQSNTKQQQTNGFE